jgi:signal transduction histidine kinase/CheY-like chemotaxis protein
LAPEELEQQRITFALEQGLVAARIAVPAAIVVAAAAARGTGPGPAAAWAALTITVLLVHNRFLRQALVTLQAPGRVAPARRVLNVSSLALAFALALLPALTFAGIAQDVRLILTLFLCCWCCAGMASLGVSPNLYTAYLLVALGGLALGWIRAGVPEAPHTVAALVLYALVLRSFAKNIARRVTEGIAIRAENAGLVRQLSAANEAKTRFIMAASHDLRQPLHAISYLGGVLARARDPDDVRNANEALTTAVEGLNKLFSAILDLSRIESGAVRSHPESFKVDALIAQLDAEYRALCVAAGRRWECQVESATALSDPALLERILRNLLDNALKHGGEGLVRLAVFRREKEVLISVSDTGPGIPPHERSRVFDEFYRVDAGSSPPGLGLGLSIVRLLVDRVGCRLEMDYTDPVAQRGTSISLHVPRGAEAVSEPAAGAMSTGEQEVAGLAVLVIDDDAAVLDATRSLLSQWQCRVATCSRAETLNQVLDDFGPPDVALVDYQLDAELNGLELVARVRLRYPEMGVVMVTGESDDRVLEQLSESGLPVLEKPVSPRELRLTLSLFKAAGE